MPKRNGGGGGQAYMCFVCAVFDVSLHVLVVVGILWPFPGYVPYNPFPGCLIPWELYLFGPKLTQYKRKGVHSGGGGGGGCVECFQMVSGELHTTPIGMSHAWHQPSSRMMILWECRACSAPAVCTQCKLLYVGNLLNPSFGLFSPVGCSITDFFLRFLCIEDVGNVMHAVRTQCEVLDVGKYSNPSFGHFSQVFGSVLGFFFILSI